MTLTTWTIDSGVVRRIRTIFRDASKPAPEKAQQPAQADGATVPSNPEPAEPGIPRSEWLEFQTVLMDILGQFPDAYRAVSIAFQNMVDRSSPHPECAQ